MPLLLGIASILGYILSLSWGSKVPSVTNVLIQGIFGFIVGSIYLGLKIKGLIPELPFGEDFVLPVIAIFTQLATVQQCDGDVLVVFIDNAQSNSLGGPAHNGANASQQ